MMLRIIYTILLLAISPFGFGCSCTLDDSLASAYKNADIIFQGKVIAIDTIQISDTLNVLSSSKNPHPHIEVVLRRFLTVKFSLTQFIKGDTQKQIITVMTDATGTRCGFGFIRNISYVVYGYSDKLTLVDNNKSSGPIKSVSHIKTYVTSSCTRTTTAVKQELSELRNNKLIT